MPNSPGNFAWRFRIPCSVGDTKITEGVPKSLGDLTWGCQILGVPDPLWHRNFYESNWMEARCEILYRSIRIMTVCLQNFSWGLWASGVQFFLVTLELSVFCTLHKLLHLKMHLHTKLQPCLALPCPVTKLLKVKPQMVQRKSFRNAKPEQPPWCKQFEPFHHGSDLIYRL